RLCQAERLAEVEVRCLMRGQESLLGLALLRGAPGQLDARTLGECPQRLGRAQAVLFFEEGEDISRLTAPEAAIAAPLGVDVERGLLFGRERTQARVRAARPPQLDPVLFDDLGEVDTLLDEVEVTRHATIVARTLRSGVSRPISAPGAPARASRPP